ncbi:MAG: oligoendopeptidase F [Mycoplasmataceae bacterium]|nr:oligoendopeptidase F [Mycoplasmataceae bacterium]
MSTKQYKNRKEVPEKYKWDLEDILKGKTYEYWIKEFKKISKQLLVLKEEKYTSEELFLKALKLEDKQVEVSFKLHNYNSNYLSTNVVDPAILKRYQELEFLLFNVSNEMGPETPLIFKNEKKIKKYLENPKFKNYVTTYTRIFETKKHQLPKAIQEYNTATSRGEQNVSELFEILTNSEMDYGFATSTAGKKIKITQANRTKLAEHKDAKVRKTASIEYSKAYLKHKGTLSNMLYQHFKTETVNAKITKHKDVIAYLVFGDRGSDKLLQTLYKGVQDNLDVFKSFEDLHKKIYKKKFGKTMTKYDHSVQLLNIKTEYTVEEQQKLVIDSTKPFGKEYNDMVKKAMSEKWIDYKTIDNKRSGAYSIGASYGLDKKYILMNDDGSIRSAETLAHEMGHSMHSYFSDTKNHLRESQYNIFVAEIASIFNELMLFDHILKTTDDDKLKFKIRQQMANGFAGTVHRQILWSNYEYDVYKAIEAGTPLSSYESLAKVYYDNAQKYTTGKPKPFKEEEQWASIMVPHFYYGFYVYKYAIGQLVANIFFQRYKETGKESLQDYIKEFLSVGSKNHPIETLKLAGVDLEDPKTYDIGYQAARDNVKELKILAKKLFKI